MKEFFGWINVTWILFVRWRSTGAWPKDQLVNDQRVISRPSTACVGCHRNNQAYKSWASGILFQKLSCFKGDRVSYKNFLLNVVAEQCADIFVHKRTKQNIATGETSCPITSMDFVDLRNVVQLFCICLDSIALNLPTLLALILFSCPLTAL